METVKVYSPVLDEGVQKDINGSPIWKGLRYTEDELAEATKADRDLYEYSFKFNGLACVQFTGMKKLAR